VAGGVSVGGVVVDGGNVGVEARASLGVAMILVSVSAQILAGDGTRVLKVFVA